MTVAKSSITKLLVVLLLIATAFCFSACAKVNAGVIVNADGTINEVVTVSLNIDTLLQQGYTVTDIQNLKDDISTTAQMEASGLIQDFVNIINWRIATNAYTDETIEILNEYKQAVKVVKADWKNNVFAIGLKFAGKDVYNYYYNIPSTSSLQLQAEKHFLYTKYYYYASTMFADNISLYQKLNVHFSLNYSEFIDSGANELSFTYATDSRREHSNATSIVKGGDGLYYHTWIVPADNVNMPVMIYYNVANSARCIMLCVGASLIVSAVLVAVGFIIIKVKNKSQNKHNEQNELNEQG